MGGWPGMGPMGGWAPSRMGVGMGSVGARLRASARARSDGSAVKKAPDVEGPNLVVEIED